MTREDSVCVSGGSDAACWQESQKDLGDPTAKGWKGAGNGGGGQVIRSLVYRKARIFETQGQG